MKKVLFCFIILLSGQMAVGKSDSDTLFNELKATINAAPSYDAKKIVVIDSLKKLLTSVRSNQLSSQYNLVRSLFEEYRIFNYDSAFLYAKELQNISYRLHDKYRIIASQIKLSFILVSAGLFKDAFDSLHEININNAPDSLKAAYYSLMGRFYYDLADYNNDIYFTPGYYQKGNLYLDSALIYYSPASFQYLYYEGLRDLKTEKLSSAISIFKNLLRRQDLDDHQLALAESTLSGIYEQQGLTAQQTALLMKAAIDDIKSSTKETTATLYLSEIFFKEGNLQSAFMCVEKSIQDAIFYGARQRQVQVSAILPIIESARVNAIEGQKERLILYSAIVTLLLILLVILIIIIYRQNNKLKVAKQIITEANIKQEEINYKLNEANKIKEEYMLHFFNINSDFLTKIERFKNSIDRKIMDRKYDELKFLVGNINIKAEKEEVLKNFDKVFLRLFPNFVNVFNSLLKEEDKMLIREGDLLNTDLRIFALMRMGITDNEKIAQILEYSVNTIYTYKSKIRKKAIVSPEEFEEKIMQTKAI